MGADKLTMTLSLPPLATPSRQMRKTVMTIMAGTIPPQSLILIAMTELATGIGIDGRRHGAMSFETPPVLLPMGDRIGGVTGGAVLLIYFPREILPMAFLTGIKSAAVLFLHPLPMSPLKRDP